jgi:hypothetical protein
MPEWQLVLPIAVSLRPTSCNESRFRIDSAHCPALQAVLPAMRGDTLRHLVAANGWLSKSPD